MGGAAHCDLAVVGAGAAGLSVAAGAARLGRSVVLFERGEMGGECLNTGCVPSKALLAAAARAHAVRGAGQYGVKTGAPEIDFAAVMAHVRGAVETIAPHDSQARFEGLGVRVVREQVRFADARTLVSGSLTLRPKRIVLATGSRPAAPPVPGLADIPYLTNETLFDLTEPPRHLLILGGGAVGAEMAQAFRRLGSEVTVIESGDFLSRFDADHAACVAEALRGEGVTILERRTAERAAARGGGVALTLAGGEICEGSHLLVAAGRAPADAGLDLAAAEIDTDARGFPVNDERLETSNPRVFVAGDAAGRVMLTHAAGAHAALLIRNLYFFQRARLDESILPAAIYTEPELARIGLSEQAARAAHGDGVRCVTADFGGNDRAVAGGETAGQVKLIGGKGGAILGASIVGREAGELIQIVQAVMAAGGSIKSLTGMISAYPTRGEAIKRAAGSWYEDAVFGPWGRRAAKLADWLR